MKVDLAKKEIKSLGLNPEPVCPFVFTRPCFCDSRAQFNLGFCTTGWSHPNWSEVDLTELWCWLPKVGFLDFEGREINLESYRGKTLFINLWLHGVGPVGRNGPIFLNCTSLWENETHYWIPFGWLAIMHRKKPQNFLEGKSLVIPYLRMRSLGSIPHFRGSSIPTNFGNQSMLVKIIFIKKEWATLTRMSFEEFLSKSVIDFGFKSAKKRVSDFFLLTYKNNFMGIRKWCQYPLFLWLFGLKTGKRGRAKTDDRWPRTEEYGNAIVYHILGRFLPV